MVGCIYFPFTLSNGFDFDGITVELSTGVQFPDELGLCAYFKVGQILTNDPADLKGEAWGGSIGLDAPMIDMGFEVGATIPFKVEDWKNGVIAAEFLVGICAGVFPFIDIPLELSVGYAKAYQPFR